MNPRLLHSETIFSIIPNSLFIIPILFHHYIISLDKCRIAREPGGQRWVTGSNKIPGHNISTGEDNAVDQTRRRANLAERWRKRDLERDLSRGRRETGT